VIAAKIFTLLIVSVIWLLGNLQSQQVLSDTTEVAVAVSPSPMASATPTPYMVVVPKATIFPTSLPTPTSNSWQYPGATQVGDNRWQSSDNPTSITNWYKDRIVAQGMTTTAFVQTNTNGQVLNKLAGANNLHKVAVEISKSEASPATSISVVLDKD